ncbi:TIGR02646 family protein [Snodgrassella alvi]|uniref:TIGR02646 family protein n=1 Tax=Snodgrassella alvi TaxID=1196083 RepID=A0A2N9XKF4_9NEIS|nr:retron Ec78 anti-phage system effector HNH endonuclease PtuB [Snodgrassella alvi]PIT48809.1 TIGR02646 family protein [Snodgrassella alvi]
MRCLVRPEKLKCLERAKRENIEWSSFITLNGGKDYKQVKEKLEEMQQKLCVYCESKLNESHIEHFKCRSKFPKEKFEWDNLFVSCTTDDHCGKYKDAPKHTKYQIDNLIKPDRDNPEDYFVFLPSGRIDKKSCLSKTDMTKADETIRVLNLNHTNLVNSRQRVYKDYYEIFTSLNESDEFMIKDETRDFEFSNIVFDMMNNIEEHKSVIDSVLSVITGEINSSKN